MVLLQQSTQSLQKHLLAILKQAGAQGLSATKMKLGAKTSRRRQMFMTLLANKTICNLGSRSRPKYVLAVFFTPQQQACQLLEAEVAKLTKQQEPRLANQNTLLKKLPAGSIREHGKQAIAQLVEQGCLLLVRFGQAKYLLHMTALSSSPSTSVMPKNIISLMTAYEQVKMRTGFANVEIYALQQQVAWDLSVLHDCLRTMSRAGKVVLSTGDWSLSSVEVRQAGLEIAGQQCLLVRFKMK